MLSSSLVVTALTAVAQLLSFATQLVIARFFGATPAMDAYLAANTIPSYIATVVLGSLGFVLVPAFARSEALGNESEAWEIADTVINLFVLVIVIFAVLGIAFAVPITRMANPGLSDVTVHVAARLSWLTWPTTVVSSVATLLAGLHQAKRRFVLQAIAPSAAGVCTILLTSILAPRLGIMSLAIATLAGLFLQAGLLVRLVVASRSYRFRLNLAHPGVRELLRVLAPLLAVGLLYRLTPVVDRFIASQVGSGVIAHLDYAMKLSSACVLLVSSGLGTVILPQLAADAATSTKHLRETLSTGLRVTWLAVVPLTAIGAVIAVPLISTLFVRGRFTRADGAAVATLLQIYLLSLGGNCLGNLTGRTFYVLKRTTLLAVVGSLQAIAYVAYAFWLSHLLGAIGVALAYAIYLDVSVVWQIALLRYQLGSECGLNLSGSFFRVAVAGGLSAAIAMLFVSLLPNDMLRAFGGAAIGLLAYTGILLAMDSWEAALVRSGFRTLLGVVGRVGVIP